MLVRNAYAKLNLSLCVGPPEPVGTLRAGYHHIVSWMHAIDLADEVWLNRSATGSSTFTVRWGADAPRPTDIDWPIEKDLAVKAHAALERAVGRVLPVELEVVKRIPVGGGLGGGSSDAGAALLGLIELFELSIIDEQLCEIAMTLGSDVAFFCDQRPGPPRAAVVSGFGEGIERVGPLCRDVVLIVPPFGCETRAVYRAFDRLLAEERPAADLNADHRAHAASGSFDAEAMIALGSALRNDLQPAAECVAPQLAEILQKVGGGTALGQGDFVMSGSGSTLFAIAAPGEGPALAARVRQANLPTGTVVTSARLVG